MIGLALAVVLLGGCAVYAEPYPDAVAPVPGIYVAPPVLPASWHERLGDPPLPLNRVGMKFP